MCCCFFYLKHGAEAALLCVVNDLFCSDDDEGSQLISTHFFSFLCWDDRRTPSVVQAFSVSYKQTPVNPTKFFTSHGLVSLRDQFLDPSLFKYSDSSLSALMECIPALKVCMQENNLRSTPVKPKSSPSRGVFSWRSASLKTLPSTLKASLIFDLHITRIFPPQ